MNGSGGAIESLRSALAGEVELAPNKIREVELLLMQAWSCLHGSEDQKTMPNKLDGRIRDLEWQPPLLTFWIERHGWPSLGSGRAEKHFWGVNLDAGSAEILQTGYRQIRKRSPAFPFAETVQRVVQAVSAQSSDPAIAWINNNEFRLVIGELVARAASKQTLESRRKTLRSKLVMTLRSIGWDEVGTHRYRRRHS